MIKNAAVCLLLGLAAPALADESILPMPAAADHYRQTGSLDATWAWLKAAAAANPQRIHVASLGRSPEGREIPLVVVDRESKFEPAEIRRTGRVIVWVQGTVDGASPDGKDAILAVIRDLALTHEHSDLLVSASVVFAPLVNVDGYERRGGSRRLDQNGPADAGRSRNAAGLEIAADHLLAESEEMRLLIAAWRHYAPEAYIDLASEAGFDHRYDLTVETQVVGASLPSLERWLGTHLPQILTRTEATAVQVLPRYVLDDEAAPAKGGRLSVVPPSYFVGYHALRGRVAMAFYAQRGQAYGDRVEALREATLNAIGVAGPNGAILRNVENVADRVRAEMSKASGSKLKVGLDWRITAETVSRKLQLWQTKYVYSAATEARFLLSSRETTDALVPMREKAEATRAVDRPVGYLLPPSLADLAARLERHGLPVRRLEAPFDGELDSIWIDQVQLAPWSRNGRPQVTATTRRGPARRQFPAGSFYVSTIHPAGDVAVVLLEPEAPESAFARGELLAAVEPDPAPRGAALEAKAAQWLDQDPALRKRFEEKRAADHEFASNPAAMHAWLIDNGPEADPSRGLYPIARVMTELSP